jgi:hypothetical protein
MTEDMTMMEPAEIITQLPGLVGFWDFREPPGEARRSRGTPHPHPLAEMGGPIRRVPGGPLSGWAARLDGSQYFRIPHAEAGDLNIGGPDAALTVWAAIRLRDFGHGVTIAGMWYEGSGENDDSGTRQYALLLNMPTYGGPRQVTPHVSSEGGLSRRADGSALPWCADYAASVSEVPLDTWTSVGFTYDGEYIRAYIGGRFEPRQLDAAADCREDPYFTAEGPDGQGRGMNPYYHGRGIFRYDPARHAESKPAGGADFTVGARYAVGSMLGEAFQGDFGGLAVFDRALSEAEMRQLHDACHWPDDGTWTPDEARSRQAIAGS